MCIRDRGSGSWSWRMRARATQMWLAPDRSSLISMVSWVMWQGSVIISWQELLKSSRSPLESPCHEIASTRAVGCVSHGVLGNTVQQCQFLKMSLTMRAEPCTAGSDGRDRLLVAYSHCLQHSAVL
eukprot:2268653-Amphidinium_carterae.2